MAEWIAFRQRYGLRSDVAYVLDVASDPSSHSELSVPLLQAEIDAVARRNMSIQDLLPALAKYGETFGAEYAGTLADGPRAVIRFTDRLAAHQADVTALFGSDAPIDVVGATFSLQELEALAAQVESERNWFPTVQAELYGASPAELDNAVRVRYKANSDAVESEILEHFGRPDWIRLKWYGPLPWTGPRGTLRAIVVDEHGQRVNGDCVLQALDPAAMVEGLPLATRNGVCEFEDVPATVFQVDVERDQRHTTSERVKVPANRTVTIEIVSR